MNTAKVIERLMIQGQSALRQGNNAEACSQFSQVMALDPSNKDVLPFRAKALLSMGKLSEAEQDLDQQETPAAIVRKLLSQANDYMDKRYFDDAEQTILKAKLYNGTSRQRTDAALMLGVLYAVTERYEEARIQYRHAQTSMPPDEDRYVANIIGLNALIRVRELAQNKQEDAEKLKVEVARDFIEAHDSIIPHYAPGHNLMAKIAVSITAGEFDAAERKLWRSISTNMEYANIPPLSQSALSNNSCLVTTSGLPVVNSKLIAERAEKGKSSFAEMVQEQAILARNGFVTSAA